MSVCDTQVGILEGKVSRNPADESRATELWKDSAQWMKFGRFLYPHANVSTTTRNYLQDLASLDLPDGESWLGSVSGEMERYLDVDTFKSNPSIKRWFITAIAVLVLVVIGWYAIKHSLSSTRKAPLRRGVYEAMYRDFASTAQHSGL
ncbi:Guanine nucleotide exchange factor lte1 [Neodidymelliopsis sp. IMI 364377]|nr:Guanine nucleotide exchange factor lte1 [Neodidymelliopsis sp. IMI 364377]